MFPGGGGHDVGIPQTYTQSEQFHRSYAGNPTNIWANYSVEEANWIRNLASRWRVVIYVDTTMRWLCEENWLSTECGPCLFSRKPLPIDFDFRVCALFGAYLKM